MIKETLRIVFLDAATLGDVSFERFAPSWQRSLHSLSSGPETVQRLEGYQVAVTNKVVLDGTILNHPAAAALQLIAVAATGTDGIDLKAARNHGIMVCNVPGYATHAVAQFTMALILELATQAGLYAGLVRAGGWEKSPMYTRLDFPTLELDDKVLGIVGYGNIGQLVARQARGFGMEVLVSARPGNKASIPRDRKPLSEVLKKADFVTLHCPLTEQTKQLIDEQALGLMKRTAFLINTARGGLVDEAALVRALRKKQLAGAALDVITQEPPSASHPIVQLTKELPNLVVTPHCAWTTHEARQRLVNEVAANIAAFERGEERNRVV